VGRKSERKSGREIEALGRREDEWKRDSKKSRKKRDLLRPPFLHSLVTGELHGNPRLILVYAMRKCRDDYIAGIAGRRGFRRALKIGCAWTTLDYMAT